MSVGVLSEMIHAHTTGKKVYVIYPFTAISPFLEYNATRIWAPGPGDPNPRTPGEVEAFMTRAAAEVVAHLLREFSPR